MRPAQRELVHHGRADDPREVAADVGAGGGVIHRPDAPREFVRRAGQPLVVRRHVHPAEPRPHLGRDVVVEAEDFLLDGSLQRVGDLVVVMMVFVGRDVRQRKNVQQLLEVRIDPHGGDDVAGKARRPVRGAARSLLERVLHEYGLQAAHVD